MPRSQGLDPALGEHEGTEPPFEGLDGTLLGLAERKPSCSKENVQSPVKVDLNEAVDKGTRLGVLGTELSIETL